MILSNVKNLIEKVPYPLGKVLSIVPFRWRLGGTYRDHKNLIHSVEESTELRLKYVLEHFSRVFEYAKTLPFYKDFYEKHGVKKLSIGKLDDISEVPIIEKNDLRPWIKSFSGALQLNTGGTSGRPFKFFVDRSAFAREWAYMHHIWSSKEYNYRCLKATFRGRNLGSKAYRYNPVHNEFLINTYLGVEKHIDKLRFLILKYGIRFFHGYPSAIYNFFKSIDQSGGDKELKDHIKKVGAICLMGSEFPLPYMVNYLRASWGFDLVSWYGHSEMCVLAFDRSNKNQYYPYQTYGLTEVVDSKLIGTSYHNFDMPLIRYDTEDLVKGKLDDQGLIEYFEIKEGRIGDFVLDRKGIKIPLTALIFGRHHKIFDVAKHVQVRQDMMGTIKVLVTLDDVDFKVSDLMGLMDFSNVDIDVDFEILSVPILTDSGKFKLLVK